jgi:hypothetical protein
MIVVVVVVAAVPVIQIYIYTPRRNAVSIYLVSETHL